MNDKNIPKLRFPQFTDEWEQHKFDDLADYKKGPFGSALRKDLFVPKDEKVVKVYEQQNAINKDWTLERYFITKEYANKLSSFSVKGGDIIVSCAGTIGEIYEIPMDAEPGIINQALMRILVNEQIVNKKMFITLFANMIDDFTQVHSNGSAIKNIPPFSDLKPMSVLLPSMQEQEKITSFFSSISNLIALHQQKCRNLKELRDGVIQRILSRELRFKRTDGSEFENWVTKELSEIFTERKVSQTITEDAPLLSFTIEQGVINPQDKKTNKRDFLIKDKDTKKFALTEVDDIIYNPANLKYGAIHRNKLMRGVVSPIYAIFYTEQNPAFMEYVVKNPTFIKNSLKYLEGTVIKLMTLKPKDFLKLKVEIPASLEEQKIIADFLMQFDETIGAEQRRIEKWKELKKGLIQQMFI